MYSVTKQFGPYSTVFRNWRAKSHCRYFHGHDISFSVTWEGPLDARSWVVDFGEMKHLRDHLDVMFDHNTIIQSDDPAFQQMDKLAVDGIVRLVEFDNVSCEAFAEKVFRLAESLVETPAQVVLVTCFENNSNAATYSP